LIEAPATTNVSDRLSSTLFVAALFHGVVILGITFSSAPPTEGDALPTLRITLVTDSDEIATAPDDADFLAQRSQTASGQLADGDRPTRTLGGGATELQSGDPASGDATDGQPREFAASADLLLTRSSADQQLEALPRPNESPAERAQRASELIAGPIIPTTAAELDSVARLSASEVRELIASPSTRESSVANYLNSWRGRVEQIGTRNFPSQALATAVNENPTLEVAINAEGDLIDIIVRRSSGDPRLDQAALTILRMAAPFEPLPAAIRSEYDVLRFAYEWEFDEG
jgi:protein TonB